MVIGVTTGSAIGPSVQSSAMTPNLDAFILGGQLFGTALQSYGAYLEADLAAETMEYNATVAERDALQVEKAKKHEIHKAKTAQRRLLARQIAVTAASGRQMSGSPLDIMARSESEAEMDQEIIRSNVASAKGRLYGQATFERGGAKTTRVLGRTRAFSNLLIGSSTAYAKSNYFKKQRG